NSVRHGLRARAIVLPGESRAEFQALLDSYVHQFKPAGDVERDLVQTLAITRWRLNRLTGVESHMFSTEMVLRRKDADRALKGMEPGDHLAWAFKELADKSNALSVLLRYEGTLTRTYERTFKQLQQLQAARKADSAPQPNEPKPPNIRVHPRPFADKKPNEP